MKKILLILILAIFSLSTFSQTSEITRQKPIKKFLFDVGVTPYQYTFNNGQSSLQAINLALGYRLNNRFHLRLNVDVIQFRYTSYFYSNKLYRYTGLSFGANYNILKDFTFILDNMDLCALAKFGVDINSYYEQESFYYDISTRLKYNELFYIGLGYNNHMFDSFYNSYINGMYFTIGFEFN